MEDLFGEESDEGLDVGPGPDAPPADSPTAPAGDGNAEEDGGEILDDVPLDE